MSNQDHLKPPIQMLPTSAVRSAAAALARDARGDVADRQERLHSEFFGQQAGVPGQGPAPTLVHEPAASVLAQRILHPTFSIVEREYRALPEQGWFSSLVSPRRPIEFQLGAFTVPKNKVLWLVDYQFEVFRLSGIDPGDFIAAAPSRFSNQMGFDVNVLGKRRSNISYQLDPQPVADGRQDFNPPVGTRDQPADAFNAAAARSFASTTSAGTSLLPRRPNVQGPRGGPFTFVIEEQSSVSLNVVIFNALTSPIAAISGRLAGWLLHTNVSSALLSRVRPR